MTKVVEARQLCKSFRGKRAVDGVDLVVRAGERLQLGHVPQQVGQLRLAGHVGQDRPVVDDELL